MDESSEPAQRRDQRERELIGHLALIAPSPELLRGVIALEVPGIDDPPGDAVPARHTDMEGAPSR